MPADVPRRPPRDGPIYGCHPVKRARITSTRSEGGSASPGTASSPHRRDLDPAPSVVGGDLGGGLGLEAGGGSHEASDAETQAYSQDEVDERMLLVRAEAEAAVRRDERRARSGIPDTAPVEYGHMPIPIREYLSRVSAWTLDERTHTDFSAYCRCTGNAKLVPTLALFADGAHVMWTQYFGMLGKCKSVDKWKARILAVCIHAEAALACRTVNGCGRLLALKYICDKEGSPVDIGLKSNSDVVGRGSSEYLAA